jgi:hypothetical protein
MLKMYQLSRFSLGNARSLAPIMIGTRKLPRMAGIAGIRKKKIIMIPCIVKRRLYTSGWKRSPCGVASSRRMRTGHQPAEREEHVDGDQVEDRDPLVVPGEEPRADAVAGVQVVVARRLGFRLMVDLGMRVHRPIRPARAPVPAVSAISRSR